MKNKSILIASEDKQLCETVLGILNRSQFIPICSQRISQILLNILEKDFDLLILDIDSSGGARTEMINVIKKVRPNLPLIVVTSDNSFETGKKIAENGVLLFLLKPIDMEKLEYFLNFFIMQNIN